jgi:hypothetical protein
LRTGTFRCNNQIRNFRRSIIALRTGAFQRNNWVRNFSFRNAFGIFALRTGAFGHEKHIRNQGFSFTNDLGRGRAVRTTLPPCPASPTSLPLRLAMYPPFPKGNKEEEGKAAISHPKDTGPSAPT